MKYGIISDIHGNYTAFRKVLTFLENQGVENIINCGDIVGYGPQPNKCVEEVSSNKKIHSVMGNHDFVVLEFSGLSKFNPHAAAAVKWTSEKLSPESMKFLAELEQAKEIDQFMFVHGSPRNPLQEYILGIPQACDNFSEMVKPLCFVGHTHCPSCFRKNTQQEVEALMLEPEESLRLKKDCKYIINVGSVGQPRDGNPQASCATYDTHSQQVRLHRLSYDVESVQRLMQEEKLPKFLSERIAKGL